MPAKKKSDSFNFEKSLAELDSLVETMEQGNLTLEDSLKKFESGIKLIRECQHALTKAEQKVQILIDQNGESTLEDFVDDEH